MHINTYLNKTTTERFWEKVQKTESCWEWQGTKSNGYGYISVSGKMYSVHRFSYWLHNKKLPKGNGWHGFSICHSCDNRKCVNPKHLFIGTHEDNMKDARRKGQFSNENNGRAKHTVEDIKRIKELYATGRLSQRELGRLFGVTHTNIYAITKGKIWR